MDIEIFKELVALDEEKANLNKRLGEITARRADIETFIVDQMVDSGIDKITINGRTLSISSMKWAKIESTREQVIAALKEAGLEEYVTIGFNSQSLSAYIRNQLESGEPLPPELNGHVGVDTKIGVRSNKA